MFTFVPKFQFPSSKDRRDIARTKTRTHNKKNSKNRVQVLPSTPGDDVMNRMDMELGSKERCATRLNTIYIQIDSNRRGHVTRTSQSAQVNRRNLHQKHDSELPTTIIPTWLLHLPRSNHLSQQMSNSFPSLGILYNNLHAPTGRVPM